MKTLWLKSKRYHPFIFIVSVIYAVVFAIPDYKLLSLIALGVYLTPKSDYKTINWILLVEFLITISFVDAAKWLEIWEPTFNNTWSICINLFFMYIFFYVEAAALGLIGLAYVVYYIVKTTGETGNYPLLLFTLQILQLMVCYWGVKNARNHTLHSRHNLVRSINPLN